ncbi:hypothetical protein ACM5F9_004795, partial [Escherichia coli]
GSDFRRWVWITIAPFVTEEDKMGEQLSIPYPGSPFTGRK